MAIDFPALRAKLIAAIKANKTHSIIILDPKSATAADALLPHRVEADDPDEYPVDVVCADVAMPAGTAEGLMDRNVIVPGDAGVVPDTNMRVRFTDSSEWAIKAVSTYDQGGVDIGYKLRICTWPESSTQQTP